MKILKKLRKLKIMKIYLYKFNNQKLKFKKIKILIYKTQKIKLKNKLMNLSYINKI